jgi:DNA modification methylase
MGSTNEGDLVLDPFMGTGTTGLVSKELNIGFELQKEYIDLEKKELDEKKKYIVREPVF